jgi:hypothetical protein
MTVRGEAVTRRRILVGAAVALCGLLAAAGMILLMQGQRADVSEADPNRSLERFRAVPYTSIGKDQIGDEAVGVVIHRRDRAWAGYNLYCSRISPEAFLMDMDGNIVHRWQYPEPKPRLSERNHAIMLSNGGVMMINEPKNLWRLDWNSKVVWKKDIAADHDVIEAEDGSFYVNVVEVVPYRGLDVRFPVIVHLAADSRELDRWSAYANWDRIRQALDQQSSLDTVLDSVFATGKTSKIYRAIPGHLEVNILKGKPVYDGLHLNTLYLLPDTPLGRTDARFRAGNLLVCFRNLNQIAVLDRGTKDFLWVWGEGILEWPHHPTMLENGNILVFDNGVLRGHSRVLELDPVTGQIVWKYEASPLASFYTYEKGSAQRLPNGNTLICEGDTGRAFEITRDGEIVWEWVNPATSRNRRVQVYRMIRYSREMVEPLLGKSLEANHLSGEDAAAGAEA